MRISKAALLRLIEREVGKTSRRPLLKEDLGGEKPYVEDVMMLVEDDADVFEGIQNLTEAVGHLIATVGANEHDPNGPHDLESPDMYADVDQAIRTAIYQVIKEQLAKWDIEVR